jgi:hypothetical protein
MILHAGLVTRRIAGVWRGALITGPSGSGKSDLALRLLDAGFSLVADDRVLLWTSGGRLFGRAPDTLAGLIEMRGMAIAAAPFRPFSPIDLAVDCDASGPDDRMPEPAMVCHLGHKLPLLRLAARQASAPAKLSRALLALG